MSELVNIFFSHQQFSVIRLFRNALPCVNGVGFNILSNTHYNIAKCLHTHCYGSNKKLMTAFSSPKTNSFPTMVKVR